MFPPPHVGGMEFCFLGLPYGKVMENHSEISVGKLPSILQELGVSVFSFWEFINRRLAFHLQGNNSRGLPTMVVTQVVGNLLNKVTIRTRNSNIIVELCPWSQFSRH